jgi:uncharacterized membrane protein YdbT with pleckstrin-like domain
MLAPRDIDEYLLPTERRVIRVRQHFASVLNDVLKTALFLLLLVVAQNYLPASVLVDNIAFYLALVAVVRFSVLTILWWIERIVITDKRVMLAQGFLVHKIAMMPLSKVTDLTVDRTVMGRMLGYGTIVLESAGQDQALSKVEFVPQPETIYLDISAVAFGHGDD